eukprot:TRINITY_DN30383_c0_g1_i1.p1 TRINITY_DN30383_c0_g1~~TRINITY_DN30383_c0_g1_i1.p1  ORF type:complete len:651 (-),score=168.23 TRINITY_DN30383_c0_g1_i1:58-2010(-)
MPATKRHPTSFTEAFGNVLLHRTGLSISEQLELHQDLLDQELELALRLDGFHGDVPLVIEDSPAATQQGSTTTGGGGGGGGGGGETKGKGKGKKVEATVPLETPSFSQDLEELMKLVQRLGPRNPNLCSAAFLKPFFKDLRLPELSVVSPLGEDISKFTKLTYLDLSRNNLTNIDQLPPNIKFLKAYNNQVTRVTCKSTQSLVFLGLGYNPLGEDALPKITKRFPNLLSLDLCFTRVGSLEALKASGLPKLRHLCLTGSPACLLPFYRLTLLRELPLLQALDGVATSEEEAADASLLPYEMPQPAPEGEEPPEAAVASGGGDGWLRLRLELGKLRQHHGLLLEALGPLEAPPTPADLPDGEEEDKPKRDPLAERCGQQGEIQLSFQLPDGSWILSSTVKLAKKTYEVEEGEPAPPVVLKDALKLHRVKQDSGQHLSFDLDLRRGGLLSREAEAIGMCDSKGSEARGLLDLCEWLRTGLPVKLWYLPPLPSPPPPAPAEEGDAGAADAGAETAETAEPAQPLQRPAPVALGGCVVPLESAFLHRTGQEVLSEGVREAGMLPASPEPWRHEVSDLQLVIMSQWLAPETQVPAIKGKAGNDGTRTANCALLDLAVTLYAKPPPTEEPPESEEEAVAPPEQPKGKAKAKAKGKK